MLCVVRKLIALVILLALGLLTLAKEQRNQETTIAYQECASEGIGRKGVASFCKAFLRFNTTPCRHMPFTCALQSLDPPEPARRFKDDLDGLPMRLPRAPPPRGTTVRCRNEHSIEFLIKITTIAHFVILIRSWKPSSFPSFTIFCRTVVPEQKTGSRWPCLGDAGRGQESAVAEILNCYNMYIYIYNILYILCNI